MEGNGVTVRHMCSYRIRIRTSIKQMIDVLFLNFAVSVYKYVHEIIKMFSSLTTNLLPLSSLIAESALLPYNGI